MNFQSLADLLFPQTEDSTNVSLWVFSSKPIGPLNTNKETVFYEPID